MKTVKQVMSQVEASAFIALANKHGVPEIHPETPFDEASAFLQERWLRGAPHQYLVQGAAPDSEDLRMLSVIGLIGAVSVDITNHNFRGVIIPGAVITTAFAKRVRLAVETLGSTKMPTVYALGSERRLDPVKESLQAISAGTILPAKEGCQTITNPETETEGIQALLDLSDTPIRNPVIINTPMQADEKKGGMRAPNTEETLIELFKLSSLEPGEYLLVTGQPYVGRQTISANRLAPKGITVIGIGYEAPITIPLEARLDELARLIFETLQSGLATDTTT